MKKLIFLTLLITTLSLSVFSPKKNTSLTGREHEFIFIPVTELKATSVKNQPRTNTCWCFATTSFIGSEHYVRAKTLFIMVNKNSVPPAIRTKPGL